MQTWADTSGAVRGLIVTAVVLIYFPNIKTCKILKIEDQYKYNVLSFMFLLKNNGLPESFIFLRNFTLINMVEGIPGNIIMQL